MNSVSYTNEQSIQFLIQDLNTVSTNTENIFRREVLHKSC